MTVSECGQWVVAEICPVTEWKVTNRGIPITYGLQAYVFSIMAHPIRLRIILRLLEGSVMSAS